MGYAFAVASAAIWVATLLLPTTADRLRGALGLPAFLLGVASVPYLPGFQGPSLTVWISAGLLLLGPALLLRATWRSRALLHPGLALVSGLAAVAALLAAWPIIRQGGALPAFATAGAIGLGACTLWLLGALSGLGRMVRRLDARRPAPGGRYPAAVLLLVSAAIGIWLAALAWPLWILSWQPIGVGAALIWLAWAAAAGRPRLALAAAALAAAFCSVYQLDAGWLMLAIAALGDRSRPWIMVGLAPIAAYLAIPILLSAEALLTVLIVACATFLLAVLAERETTAPAESR